MTNDERARLAALREEHTRRIITSTPNNDVTWLLALCERLAGEASGKDEIPRLLSDALAENARLRRVVEAVTVLWEQTAKVALWPTPLWQASNALRLALRDLDTGEGSP